MDPELEAMSAVAAAVQDLEPEARERVLSWAANRYGAELAERARGVGGRESQGEGQLEAAREASPYQHFADLLDEFGPSTDDDRALAGAYWFQEIHGSQSFQAQQVNNALKDVGHGVTNIARSLGRLQERSPALVRQLSKSGRTKQARKTYKLTTAGVNEVRRRLSEPARREEDE